MWVRTQLKIGWTDLLAGAAAALMPPDRDATARDVEAYFAGDGRTLATYSVRTGFDLLLQALDLKPGDEVLFSALNVRGMVRIVREAGLVPVPVDLELGSMGPSVAALERAITPRTKVLVTAHLFGTRLDFAPLFRLARARGIIAVEDCAQAFNGRDYAGSPDADVVLFSFGPIKTATALGGALVRVRDQGLLQRMRAIAVTYPVQPDKKQLKRVFQFLGLKLVTLRPILAAIYRYHRARGRDYEDALADRVRDVAPLKTAKNLRQRPSAGMLALMKRRLTRFDETSITRRTAKGERLRDLIGDAAVQPAQQNSHHDYWVFPLVVKDPRRFIEGLRAEGFDAADLPRSQHIAAPADRPELEPGVAAGVMRDLIVLPCYDTMPDGELVRQAETVKRLAGQKV